jgi:ArsR family transcriptional regulator
METKQAIAALSALAHEGRLTIFRELVQAGSGGLPAGDLARRLGILPNTLSNSLAILSHAGLASSRRQGRSIIYAAAYGRISALLGFLTQDCCAGSAEVCEPLAAMLAEAACCETSPNLGASA